MAISSSFSHPIISLSRHLIVIRSKYNWYHGQSLLDVSQRGGARVTPGVGRGNGKAIMVMVHNGNGDTRNGVASKWIGVIGCAPLQGARSKAGWF